MEGILKGLASLIKKGSFRCGEQFYCRTSYLFFTKKAVRIVCEIMRSVIALGALVVSTNGLPVHQDGMF